MAENFSDWGWSGNSGMRGHVVAWTEYTDNSHFNIIVTGNTQCSEYCESYWDMQSQVGYDARYSGMPGTSSGAGQHTASWDWCTEGHYYESVTNGWADYHKETFGPFQCDASTHNLTVWYKTWAAGSWGGGERDAFATLATPVYKQHTPNAPKNFEVTRSSDTTQKLTWEGNYTDYAGLYAWDCVYVERSVDGGSFSQIAKLSWSATNWSDNSTARGHKYTYRMRAENSGDGSTKKYSAYTSEISVFTAPSVLSALKATKSGEAEVTLAATGVWSWRDSVQVQVKQNGGDWADVSAETVDTSTWRDAAAPAGTLVYRIRAGVKQGGSARADTVLYGDWTSSNEIVTICPPKAPSVSAPSVVAIGDTLTVTWKKSHPDGTAQTSAQAVLYDLTGATLETQTITGTLSKAEFDTSGLSIDLYRVRVRTKGLDDDWGAWSSYKPVAVSAYPTVTIDSPAIDYDGTNAQGKLPIQLAWTAACDDGISYQTVEVFDADGTQLWAQRLTSMPRSLELGAAVGFVNESGYSIRLTVYGGGGLAVSASRALYTEWYLPAEPKVDIQYSENLAALIRVVSSEDPDTDSSDADTAATDAAAAAVSDDAETETLDIVDYDIVRVGTDGERLVIGEHLPLGYQVTDTLPPLNTEFSYEVTARSSLDTVCVKSFATICDSDGMEAFNFGAAAQECVLLGLNANSSANAEMSGETYNFALGALAPMLPTFYPDGTMSASKSLSYVVHDREKYEKVRTIARTPAYACFWYRDYWGHRMYCHGQWSTGYDAQSYSLWDVSVSPEEVVWREPING